MFKAAAQGKVLNKVPAGKGPDAEICLLHRCCITSGRCRCCTTAESHCGRKVFKGKKTHKTIYWLNVKIPAVKKVYASEETRLLIPTRQKELAALQPNT